jgi:hypothetical protein
MSVMQARTESGGTVALEFGVDGVRVRAISSARQRALRLFCGLVFVAFGTGAVAVNIDTQASVAVGDWVWVAAGVLALGCVGAGVWWLVEVVRDRRRPAGVITVGDVTESSSAVQDGLVTVSLTLAAGGERSFSALGYRGTVLANEFRTLLAVAA